MSDRTTQLVALVAVAGVAYWVTSGRGGQGGAVVGAGNRTAADRTAYEHAGAVSDDLIVSPRNRRRERAGTAFTVLGSLASSLGTVFASR